MSDLIFGQPWHGRLTPGGLVLADESVKTTMAGTDATGAAKTFNYLWSGTNVSGATFYHKVPDLPVPTTPTALVAIGGEFKNDCILFGDSKRYSPFAGSAGLSGQEWPHYGSDGVWRKMTLVVTATGAQSNEVKIYRGGRLFTLNAGDTNASTLIATMTLDYTSAVGAGSPILSAPDVRFDGRQIVVTRRDTWANPIDPAYSTPWNNATQRGIVAAWKIDIAADANSATATRVWQVEAVESGSSLDRTHLVSTGMFYTGSPGNWVYHETYSGIRQGGADSWCTIKRLVGAAYDPTGNLVLIEYTHHRDSVGAAAYTEGTVTHSTGYTLDPVLPAQRPDVIGGTGSYFGTHDPDYPYVQIDKPWGTTYENPIKAIVVDGATSTIATLTTPLNPALYATPITNNVFDLHNGAVSKGRFGPGGSDVSDSTLSPRYASYNPRTNSVHTSATPIGFV